MANSITRIGQVEQAILLIRDQRVMLDTDLANIYGVSTRRLNEQIKRNADRFPSDFMFQLNKREKKEVVAICDHLHSLKFSPHLPYAFTEHGAIMAANVLKSKHAVEMSVFVVRAFVRLRETAITYRELAERLKELEQKVGKHDKAIQAIVETLRQLMQPPDLRSRREKPKRKIGFRVEERRRRYGAGRFGELRSICLDTNSL